MSLSSSSSPLRAHRWWSSWLTTLAFCAFSCVLLAVCSSGVQAAPTGLSGIDAEQFEREDRDYRPLQFGKRETYRPLQFGKKRSAYRPLQFGKRAGARAQALPLAWSWSRAQHHHGGLDELDPTKMDDGQWELIMWQRRRK